MNWKERANYRAAATRVILQDVMARMDDLDLDNPDPQAWAIITRQLREAARKAMAAAKFLARAHLAK